MIARAGAACCCDGHRLTGRGRDANHFKTRVAQAVSQLERYQILILHDENA
jgi:hypothetical protein